MADNWLLLLPRPPSEVSLDTLQVAYSPSITPILRDASRRTQETGEVTHLDLGIAYPRTLSHEYTDIQRLFALVYELICIACTKLDIDVQSDNDVDTRVFLYQDPSPDSTDVSAQDCLVLPALASIAHSDRAWTRLSFVQSERGEGVLRDFTVLRESSRDGDDYQPEVVRVPGGLSIIDADRESSPEQQNGHFPQHQSVAVGGTFDHLHAGHKLLLTMTALLCAPEIGPPQHDKPCLTIGITGDELLKNKKFKEQLEDWHQRQQSARTFVTSYLDLHRSGTVIVHTQALESDSARGRTIVDTLSSGMQIRYAEIFDPYGPTIEDVDISALVISAETRSGGDSVNAKRKEKGWPALDVFEVQVLDGSENASEKASTDGAEGFANKLSSTEIRSRIHKKEAAKS